MEDAAAREVRAGLFSFRVEFSILCPRCDHPLPLDGPLRKVHCPSCQSDVEVPRDYWTETLGNACSDMQETDIGAGSGSMLIGTFQGNLTLARFDPYCDECKTGFEDPWNLSPGVPYLCAKCGASWPVQLPPPWLKEGVPRVRQLINALLAGGEPGSGPPGPDPVSLSCPACSGQLEVSGSSRLIRCGYCGGQVYVPDDLWLRIHGRRMKRRWFVVCEYADEGE